MFNALFISAAASILVNPPVSLHADPQPIAEDIQWGAITDDGALWDNGDPDGRNGLSNAARHVFGAQRTLLFDFEVPPNTFWDIDQMTWQAIWNDAEPGAGFGAVVRIHEDVDGRPGVPILPRRFAISYEEIPTIHSPKYQALARFEPMALWSGRYWIEATVLGPENNFWETTAVNMEEVWVNYEDFGGLRPGSEVFGTEYEINGRIGGISRQAYTLELSGTCPGDLTIAWSGAGDGGQQALVVGNHHGRTVIRNPCAGTVLGLRGSVMFLDPPGIFSVGPKGEGMIVQRAIPAACGKYLQLVKGGICTTSNVARIPTN